MQSKRNELINLQNSPEAATMSLEEAEKLTKQIQDLDIAILQMKENSKTAFQQFVVDLQLAAGEALKSGLNTFFNDLIEGSKSASEALKDFVRNFIKAIGQLIVQAMAAYAALIILNAIPGGAAVAYAMNFAAAGANAAKGTQSAGVHHTGGIAGSGGVRRNIDLATYNHAPRYHAGGVAGFAPNEVPAILERGEEVLTRNDPRHIANGGGQNNTSIRIYNNIQDSEIHDAVATPAGEKTIVNIIGRNASAIRRILEDS